MYRNGKQFYCGVELKSAVASLSEQDRKLYLKATEQMRDQSEKCFAVDGDYVKKCNTGKCTGLKTFGTPLVLHEIVCRLL